MGLYDEFRFRPASWLPHSELPLEELPNGLRGKRVGREKIPGSGALEKTEEERVC